MDEITAEYTAEAIAPNAELRVRPRVTVGCKSDLGRVRENNEDKLEYYLCETDAQLATKGLIFVVCDGMGGHEAGQIASELATKTFIDVYLNHPSERPDEAARSAVMAANRFVLDVARAVPSRRGMGTTLSALMIVQDRAFIAQVGDSRVYRLREGELTPMTVDHTWVEEAVRSGMMDRETAEQHPYRHVLTRAVGTEQDVAPDIFQDEVKVGDVYMLCSDGLTNHVTDEQLPGLLAEGGPSQIAWNLVSHALVGGGSDNATVLVVRVDALEVVQQPS